MPRSTLFGAVQAIRRRLAVLSSKISVILRYPGPLVSPRMRRNLARMYNEQAELRNLLGDMLAVD